LWNGNDIAREGAPGQKIYCSTSFDGRNWTEPEAIFASSEYSQKPIPCVKGYQWQPCLGLVNGVLWAVWSQLDRNPNYNGAYLSQLKESDGKWVNRRLEWEGSASPVIGGKKYRVFPTQNLYQLRSGRVLAPVTLMWGQASDAPKNISGFWGVEKRNSVLYTDDLGKSWQVSAGCIQPNRSWANWEPTVWEVSDGRVLMVARNNVNPGLGHEKIKSSEYLLSSVSCDGGATWSPHEYVLLETICSRMHVVPLDGRGAWKLSKADDDYSGRAYIMLHNDRAGGGNWTSDRRNLALFMNRGEGFTFVPGVGLTNSEPRVCYPHMWVHDGTMLISYTVSFGAIRSPKVIRIHPLPDIQKRYLFVRNNLSSRTQPERIKNFFRFVGTQRIESRDVLDVGEEGFSIGAWVRVSGGGVFIDSRSTNGGGVLIVFKQMPDGRIRPVVWVNSKKNPFVGPDLSVTYGKWQYVGLTFDNRKKEGAFYLNDKEQKVSFKGADKSLKGTTACIGYKRLVHSKLSGFAGDIRSLVVYSGVIGSNEHRWLYNRFADEFGMAKQSSEVKPKAEPILCMNPADKKSLETYFSLPVNEMHGASVLRMDEGEFLRISGESSVGVDIDENYRSKGDEVILKFSLKMEDDYEKVLCTVGDAVAPARVLVRGGRVLLYVDGQEECLGLVEPDKFFTLEVATAKNRTKAKLDNGKSVQINHNPKGTWVFLGEGYPQGKLKAESRFLVEVASVRSLVVR
jgi:hypothetical protein